MAFLATLATATTTHGALHPAHQIATYPEICFTDNRLQIYLTSYGGRREPQPFNHTRSANGKGK